MPRATIQLSEIYYPIPRDRSQSGSVAGMETWPYNDYVTLAEFTALSVARDLQSDYISAYDRAEVEAWVRSKQQQDPAGARFPILANLILSGRSLKAIDGTVNTDNNYCNRAQTSVAG